MKHSMAVNPDLLRERAGASFPVGKLTNLLDGGTHRTNHRKHLERIVWGHEVFDMSDHIFLSDQEKYEKQLQMKITLFQLKEQHKLNDRDIEEIRRFLLMPLDIHTFVFIPTVEQLGTEEQKRDWLPKARAWQLISTYAQTELAHGTNLRKLETTATYDPETEEFIINTPQITSMKWWPGGLGKTANHALVMANLYLGKKNCGLQAFLVPIRNKRTHEMLPGVEVGWIGPVYFSDSLDNGYLKLCDVRIPRTNMLMKYSQVTPDGRFSTTGDPRANYASMVSTRVMVVQDSGAILSRAVTIAIRYSAVRRQSEFKPGAREPQILDYTTQQQKLFPYLAAAYALHFTANSLQEMFNHIQETQIKKGDFSGLAELHSLSSGLKALSTELAAEGAESCRRSCGGHGYSLASGLPHLSVAALGAVTAEGEATVLHLQTARYLIKMMRSATSSKQVTSSCTYLTSDSGSPAFQTEVDFQNLNKLVQAFSKRAYGMVQRAAEKIREELGAGKEAHVAWNNSAIWLVQAAKAHSERYIIAAFVEGLRNLNTDHTIRAVLTRLCVLYAIFRISAGEGQFLQAGAISLKELKLVHSTELSLLAALRPDAVALVDAFDWHDKSLNSALGSYDGNVYTRLYDTARRAPMNEQEVLPAFQKLIKPLHQESKL